MLIKELKQFILQKELVTFRRECAEDDITGTILSANESIVIMCLWSDEGNFDGVTVFETDQIEEVLWGNREHKAISQLIEQSGYSPSAQIDSTNFISAVHELFAKYKHVELYHEYGEDSFDICSIIGNDGEWLKILTYGPKRTLSRLSKLVKINSLLRVTVDSPYQNNIVDLHATPL